MKRLLVPALTVAIMALAGFAFVSKTAIAQTAMMTGPASGFTLHIDADKHFGDAHPNEIAHHWCKTISPTLTECQLYDGDGPHARLVGVETIVPTAVWKTFAPDEQALWHYHATELKKIHATLPGMSKAQAAKTVAMISQTYGKVYILWDPMTSKNPIGQPSVTVLK
jgi:hypothetical protein